MHTATIAGRWALTRLAAEPLAWIAGVVLLAAGPVYHFAADWLPGGGWTAGPADELGGEIVFLGVLLGTGLVAARLEGLRALLARAKGIEIWRAETVALSIGALCGALPGIIWALVGEREAGSELTMSHLWAALLAAGHAAALASFLARLPLGPSGRSVALPLLAWGFPALLPSEPRTAGVALWLLHVSRPLGSPLESSTGLPPLAALAPMILLWAAGCWLGAEAARQP